MTPDRSVVSFTSPSVDWTFADGNIAKCRIGFATTMSVTEVTAFVFSGTLG